MVSRLNTPSWLRETWSSSFFEDILYVSANPFVNSKGIEKNGFDGAKHFGKILDVWEWGCEDSLGIALPEKVAKEARLARAQHPEKRLVVHFLQPHQPYVVELENENGGELTLWEKALEKFRNRAFKIANLGGGAVGVISDKIKQFLSKFGVTGKRPVESFAQTHGDDKLKHAYRENVRRALESTGKLIDRLPGKIIITSDHGEFLGEGGFYGHHYDSEHSIQREVPWMGICS